MVLIGQGPVKNLIEPGGVKRLGQPVGYAGGVTGRDLTRFGAGAESEDRNAGV